MASSSGRDCKDRAVEAFQPVSDMLDVGQCEPLKAAVHGVLLATVAVCAAYNAAAWLKRRQRHLAVNALVYGAAVLWERAHVLHHLVACPAEDARPDAPERPQYPRAAEATERDAA
jgi:hypothetical protein